jgi:hypothetical protein
MYDVSISILLFIYFPQELVCSLVKVLKTPSVKDLSVHTLQALVRKYILMDMSDLIIASSVQEIRIAKIIYS